jgi:hypothetical protein
MTESAEQIAADRIAYARYKNLDDAPERIAADAMSMVELSEEQPDLAWSVVQRVLAQYSESDLFTRNETEAKRVIALVAASPLEDYSASTVPTSSRG